MGFLSKIFSHKGNEEKVGGMQDYMTLIRVYFQSAIAAEVGITNMAMLPDMRVFKATFHVPTQNNTDDSFFKEIDQSIHKHCHKMQDVQVYMLQFQNFTQDLMMLVGNLMKFKLRLPSMFRKALYTLTEKTVNDIFTKNDFKDPGVIKTVLGIRKYNQRLGFSQKWITDFVFQVVMLAKKEPRPGEEEEKK